MKVVQNLFEERSLSVPDGVGDLLPLFEESMEIVGKAIVDNQPYAVCLMLSGGDDSITALHVALMLGVKIDFIVHGITGTGLPEVREYVTRVAERSGIRILYADAGDTFVNYVRRKGFFGRGKQAHSFAYHLLKRDPFNATLSRYLRKGVGGRRIILLNGVRVEESDNRADNYGDDPYRWDNNNLWVNIIHWWDKKDCLQLLDAKGVQRNPVSIALNRSGECNCGTMQSQADFLAACEFNHIWGGQMHALRNEIVHKFGWDIWENPNKKILAEMKQQAEALPSFMPMCVGCKSRANQLDLFGQ